MIQKQGFECRVLDVDEKAGSIDVHAPLSRFKRRQVLDASACHQSLSGTPAWLVVDHYALDRAWENAIRPSVGKIMVIDDLANREHHCDALLDQNVGLPTRYAHLVPVACETLIGPEYALLRDEFVDARSKERSGLASRINVFMGGTDSEGATVRVLDDLIEGVNWEKLDVVLGTRCPHLDAVCRRIDQLPAAELHLDSNCVAGLFADADVAIGAGGVAALERCCVGLPSLCICVADNQSAGLAELTRLGIAESLGSLRDLRSGQIAGVLRSLMQMPERLRQMSRGGMDLVDGRGAHRVADIMLSKSAA
jgi:UDP-2,4-diacetamido-2,4,6-trideoxy-beta-L-altropyranose hydrolase